MGFLNNKIFVNLFEEKDGAIAICITVLRSKMFGEKLLRNLLALYYSPRMTKDLQQVFNKIAQLKSAEQNAIAKIIAEELSWELSLNQSQDQLSVLAEEALEEYKRGKTRPFKT